jgi:hypothetical protein
MGGARRLPHAVRERLVPELAARTDALVLLAFADGRPVGAAVCFRDPAPTLFLEKRLLPAAGC